MEIFVHNLLFQSTKVTIYVAGRLAPKKIAGPVGTISYMKFLACSE